MTILQTDKPNIIMNGDVRIERARAQTLKNCIEIEEILVGDYYYNIHIYPNYEFEAFKDELIVYLDRERGIPVSTNTIGVDVNAKTIRIASLFGCHESEDESQPITAMEYTRYHRLTYAIKEWLEEHRYDEMIESLNN